MELPSGVDLEMVETHPGTPDEDLSVMPDRYYLNGVAIARPPGTSVHIVTSDSGPVAAYVPMYLSSLHIYHASVEQLEYEEAEQFSCNDDERDEDES